MLPRQMPQQQENQSHQPFYNPNSRDTVITEILNRLDDKDKEYTSLHGQMVSTRELLDKVYEQTLKTNGRVTNHDSLLASLSSAKDDVQSIKAWLKGLISVGSGLMLLLALIGWLLSNDYLSFHTPARQVQTLNSTHP